MQALEICWRCNIFGDVWWDGEERVVACLWIEGVFFEFVEEVYAVVLDAVPDIEGSKYSRLEDGVVIGETGLGS